MGDAVMVPVSEMVFTASCENADRIFCEVCRVAGEGRTEWIEWLEEDGPTAEFDLGGLNLTAGTYQLRIGGMRAGKG